MLTTSSLGVVAPNGYLTPDYLQPLPTSMNLDSKQSPLALLAQTCNSIGKDSKDAKDGDSKDLLSVEKKDGQKERDSSGKGSPKSGSKSPSLSRERRDSSPGAMKSIRDEQGKRSPGELTSRDSGRLSSHGRDDRSPGSNHDGKNPPSSRPGSTGSPSSMSLHSKSKISLSCGNVSVEVKHQESLSSSTSSSSSSRSAPALSSQAGLPDPLAAAHATALHSLPGAYHGLPLLGHHPHHPLDSTSSASSAYHHHPGLAAHSSLGSFAAGHKPGLSPLFQYTTVKTASGTTLVPLCKDPCCSQCQLSVRNAQLGSASCPPGCTQCPSDKPGMPTSSLPAPTALPGMPGLLSSSAASSHLLASSLHPFSVLPGHHSLPYVCSWLHGSDYCGKRFGTSEELLQHLRTHTTTSDLSALSALPYPNLGLTTAAAAAAAAAAHGLPPSPYPTAGSISPNTLRQLHPGRLSPTSMLAAARYHPYKAALSSLSAAAPGQTPSGVPGPLGSLSPYYLPYSLYGQRLGPVVSP